MKIGKATRARNRELFLEFDRMAQQMGLSIVDRASVMGVTQGSYSMYKNGRVPSDQRKLCVAKARLTRMQNERAAGGRSNGHGARAQIPAPKRPKHEGPQVNVQINGMPFNKLASPELIELVARYGGSISVQRSE